MSEKTEQPTPKKLRDARQKGQVASSKEVASTALIISVFALLWGLSDTYIGQFEELILLPTAFIHTDFESAFHQIINGILQSMISILIPLVALVIIVSIASHFSQYGMLFSIESIKPDLNKLNPIQGVKKIFSIKNLMEFIKSVIKIVFLSTLLFLVFRDSLPDLLKIPPCGLSCIIPTLGALFKQIILYSTGGFVVISAADFLFQRYQHIKQLKMSKEEIKQEYKEMEGDPHIKSKRRHLHQEMLSQQMANSVRKSTVVVTNPTHIAVALEYREGQTPLPVVRAKGTNLIAKRIVEIAREEGIPVFENVPLAQALNENGLVDQYIPGDLIPAVVEVLRWVANLENQ